MRVYWAETRMSDTEEAKDPGEQARSSKPKIVHNEGFAFRAEAAVTMRFQQTPHVSIDL